MKNLELQTSRPVVPMIYAYETPEIARHNGWVKIGDTEQAVDQRIAQQTHTADVEGNVVWQSEAVYDDGSGETFRDYDFHRYLQQNGIERKEGTEWFHIDAERAEDMLTSFKKHRTFDPRPLKYESVPYKLRPEQQKAVDDTAAYFNAHPNSKYLWNAKPRFGKTLSVYELARKLNAERVLIVTNRPVVATSWYHDYAKFVRGWDEGWYFACDSDELNKLKTDGDNGPMYFVETKSPLLQGARYFMFLSLQDLKGSEAFGGIYTKLDYVNKTDWDMLVIDESHEGVATIRTNVALDRLTRKWTLYLSGTPFKALASNEFSSDQIFNWTYVDEQAAKADWHGEGNNPYADLPRLHMYTYRMSDLVRDQVEQGFEYDDEPQEFAFDLNEFFSTDERGHFVHLAAVNEFIHALTTQKKFPFSTPELRDQLKHTLWLLDRVASARALATLLKNDPVFENYEVILAAGDGKIDADDDGRKSFDKVTEAIHGNPAKGVAPCDKTITLSVGQLTTGVTIPEWTGVLMLSNIESAALYMQAAFRAQNPALVMTYSRKEKKRVYLRKTDCYVFDFDPARTLDIYERFANGLYSSTASGNGTTEERKQHIRQLLNFFPVLGEDENGEMIELNAEQVLSVPRQIRSREVVRTGFMSNFLFQNVGIIFNAPKEVRDILGHLPAVGESKKESLPDDPAKDLDIDDDGNINVPNSVVIGTAADIFGDKKYGDDVEEIIKDNFGDTAAQTEAETKKQLNDIKTAVHASVDSIITDVRNHYGDDMRKSDIKSLDSAISSQVNREIDRKFTDFSIQKRMNEAARKEELAKSETSEQDAIINKKYDDLQKQAGNDFTKQVADAVSKVLTQSQTDAVQQVETRIQERKRDSFEDDMRDHLRGFARTIPEFLMAYGADNTITLQTFDQIVPDDVFKEVTGISLADFRLLRDGADYTADDGTTKHFNGHVFDEIVMDDSIVEFMNLKHKLANYFDESNKDIFDYVPPQKTNMIFTPRKVVKEMVDMLEEENPGCFDRDDATFADLYMKSGMYITEIVKRLYNSDRMKQLYPDSAARLSHIFAHQVYGLAPTEIIYRVCLSYILGFSDEIKIDKHNIRMCDALKYAKEGTLEKKLEEMFPALKNGA